MITGWEQDYARVGDHRWLAGRRLFVAEGRIVVERLLEAGRFRLHSILLTPAALAAFGGILDTDVPVHVVEQDVLNRVTGFNFHRGCLALAYRPEAQPAAAVLFGARRLLALEGVGNPDNVGGLFRVAAAFGVGGVLLDPATGDPFYRKAIRTSMGAVLRIPFQRLEPWPAALETFREQGFRIVALTPRTGARPLAEFAQRAIGPTIMLVGSEGSGLSDAALGAADALVRIPTAPDVDSLNVTVAAGIALAYLAA